MTPNTLPEADRKKLEEMAKLCTCDHIDYCPCFMAGAEAGYALGVLAERERIREVIRKYRGVHCPRTVHEILNPPAGVAKPEGQ